MLDLPDRTFGVFFLCLWHSLNLDSTAPVPREDCGTIVTISGSANCQLAIPALDCFVTVLGTVSP